MKRILFFETSAFTGATRVTRAIAKELQGNHEVFFATVIPGKQIQKEIIQDIESLKPNILFSSFVSINPDVIEAGNDVGLRTVIRTDYKLADMTDQQRYKLFKTYPRANLLLAQTKELREELLSIPGVKPYLVKVIENPLDEEDILEQASVANPFPRNGMFHFLWVGRKDPIKDINTLKKAFELVHRKFPLTDMTLISNEANPYKWIKNADCLVISSKSEASPNVLREALFLRTEVISTNCSPTVRTLLPKDRICLVGDYRAMAELMTQVLHK